MGDDAVDRLRAAQAPAAAGEESGAASPPPVPRGRQQTAPAGLRGQVKRTIRKAIAWYGDEKAQEAADAAADRAADRVLVELGARLDEHERRLESGEAGEVRALTINLELLKGELRGLQRVLDDLGEAIAPAAGIDGAVGRMGELRDRVHSLERRTRGSSLGAPTPTTSATPPPSA